MNWLTQLFVEQNLAWLLITTVVSIAAGFLSSWLTYRFVKQREILDTIHAEIAKQQALMDLETESEKQARIRREVIRWANPILSAVRDLESQLSNILTKDGYLAMTKNYKEQVNPNWSISYEYFMNSTLFLFGQYFAWVRMLEEELNFELFQSQKEKDQFFAAIGSVTRALASFPPSYPCTGQDTQVFKLQQRAIGELLIMRETEQRRCMSYPEFLQRLSEPSLQQNLQPLRELLDELSPANQCRWQRVETTNQALKALKDVCEKLLVLSER